MKNKNNLRYTTIIISLAIIFLFFIFLDEIEWYIYDIILLLLIIIFALTYSTMRKKNVKEEALSCLKRATKNMDVLSKKKSVTFLPLRILKVKNNLSFCVQYLRQHIREKEVYQIQLAISRLTEIKDTLSKDVTILSETRAFVDDQKHTDEKIKASFAEYAKELKCIYQSIK